MSANLVDGPGIYDMPAAIYHADPIPGESLSSTGARTIVNECPAVYRYQKDHREQKREFDIGSATHLLVLEPDLFAERVAVIRGYTKKGDYSPGYTTDDARAQRDAAYAAGKIPLLPEEMDLISNMRAALHAHPVAAQAFVGGSAEKSLFWRDAEAGIWCRTRPDYLPPHSRYMVDLKTAYTSDPEDFARSAANYGLHMQAAWYLDGHEKVLGVRPERFAFVVVCKKPPHLVSVLWIDHEAMQWGEKLNRYARHVFAWCKANCRTPQDWPGYVDRIGEPVRAFTLSLPAYELVRLQKLEETGRLDPPIISRDEEAQDNE